MFNFDENMVHVFNKTMKEVYNAKTLGLHDPEKECTLEVTSEKGLSACLLQSSIPISFASKGLTPAERHYSNIEWECLAVVFGLEYFRQFVFGREVIIKSDHKLLVSIFS